MSAKQTLIIICGSPCVGKTTVADSLFQSLENSAWLDGDWCWCVNPFSISDPRLRNGDKSMSFVLSNYLNSGFRYVIFSTVVATFEDIRAAILRDITAKDYDTIGFTLTCTEQTLVERHQQRGDGNECSFQWLYDRHPGDIVIQTDGKTATQIASEIKDIIEKTRNMGDLT